MDTPPYPEFDEEGENDLAEGYSSEAERSSSYHDVGDDAKNLREMGRELGVDWDAAAQPTASERASQFDFDEWVAPYNDLVEAEPDLVYFMLFRTYPKTDAEGNWIAGLVGNRIQTPLSLEGIKKRVGHIGGRYVVQFHGPSKGRRSAIIQKSKTIHIPKEDEEADLMKQSTKTETPSDRPVTEPAVAPLLAPQPLVVSNDLSTQIVGRWLNRSDKLEEEVARLRAAQAPQVPSATPASRFPPMPRPPTDNDEDDKEGDDEPWEDQRSRSIYARGRRETPYIPVASAPPAPNKFEGVVADAFTKLFDQRNNDLTPAPVPADHAEVERLHALVTHLQDAHRAELLTLRTETADRVQEQRAAADSQIHDQHVHYEQRLDDLRERNQQAITAAEARARDEVERIRVLQQEKVDQLREHTEDLKNELQLTKVELVSIRSELSAARDKAILAESRNFALESTQESKIEAIKAIARADAAEERAKSAPLKKDEDALTTMLSTVSRAKDLTEVLGKQLSGGSSDAAPAAKPSFLRELTEAGIRMASSPDVRKLAEAVAGAAVKGATSLAKATSGPGPLIPSTAALIKAREQRDQQQMIRLPTNAVLPEPTPRPAVIDVVPTQGTAQQVVQAAAEAVSNASNKMEQARLAAEDMLGEVEDMAAQGVPVPEAAQSLLSRIVEMAGISIEDAAEAVKGAKATDVLKQFDLPPERLSPAATFYLDGVLQHVGTLTA